MLGVEQYDTELLDWARTVARQQIRRHVAWGPELHAAARLADQRPAAQLDRGQDLRRLDGADPLQTAQIGLRLSRQAVHATHRLQDAIRHLDRTCGTNAVAQDDGQQLVVAQT